MDPYLEPHWLDVHGSLVILGRNALNDLLPDELIARSDERVGVEADESKTRRIGPDVRVFEPLCPGTATAVALQRDVDLAPYRLKSISDPIVERYIEIIESTGGRLVTVIEFLSPTNKQGEGLREFVRKREELLAGQVNVVEVDLNRSGNWQALIAPNRCPGQAMAPYRAMIRTATDPRTVHLHPFSLRQPLPAIKIPLRPRETPVELPLQPLIEQAYHYGRYARTIDYSKPPEPPLDPDEAAWADQLLRPLVQG